MAAENLAGVGRRLDPTALVELRARPQTRHVEQPRVQVALAAVLDPDVEVAVGERVVARDERGRGEVGMGAGDVLLEPGLERKREAVGERPRAAGDPAVELGGADVVQRVHEDLGRAETLGESIARPPQARAPAASLASIRSWATLL